MISFPDKIHTISIAFYKANTDYAEIDDKLIAWWTRGDYSHVELVINNNVMISSSGRDGGVRIKKHTYNTDQWKYISIDIEPKYIKEFYEQTKNDKYDFLGILGFIFPIKDRTNKWFCSEWVSNVLKISGCKKLFTLEPSKISPNELYYILKEIK